MDIYVSDGSYNPDYDMDYFNASNEEKEKAKKEKELRLYLNSLLFH